jgi:tryptophanyl-tRNA synthetase
LLELITETFKTERKKYNYYINNLAEPDTLLKINPAKATLVANGV